MKRLKRNAACNGRNVNSKNRNYVSQVSSIFYANRLLSRLTTLLFMQRLYFYSFYSPNLTFSYITYFVVGATSSKSDAIFKYTFQKINLSSE